MALFGSGYQHPGLMGGATAPDNKWLQALSILGATLQDVGAAENGRQGYALPMAQQNLQRLGDQKKYQEMLGQLSAPGTASVTPPSMAFAPPPSAPPQLGPGREIMPRDISPGSLQVNDPGSLNASPAGPLSDPRLAQMLPILQGLDPEKGLPLLFNSMQGERDAAREDARYNQQRADQSRRPATPEEKAKYGLDPNTPAEIDGRGNITPISDPRAITPQQQAQMDLQRAQFAETRRHNQAQEASGREGGGGLFSMIDTGQGVYGVTRKGDVRAMMGPDGKPLVSYHSDPSLRFNMNAAGTGGKAAGTSAEAWPKTQADFKIIGDTIKGFYEPKVREQAPKAIGFGAMAPTVPGVNSDFRSRQKSLGGQIFLQAFNSLRGGGAITENEGAKAESAYFRAINANTPDEFYSALDELSGIMGTMHHASRTRAERGAVVPQMSVGAPDQAPSSNNDPLGIRR